MTTIDALAVVLLSLFVVLLSAMFVGAVVGAVLFGMWLDSLLLQWLTL